MAIVKGSNKSEGLTAESLRYHSVSLLLLQVLEFLTTEEISWDVSMLSVVSHGQSLVASQDAASQTWVMQPT